MRERAAKQAHCLTSLFLISVFNGTIAAVPISRTPPARSIAWLIAFEMMFPVVAALVPAAAQQQPQQPEEAARPLETIKKEMAKAVAAKNFPELGRLVEEAAGLKDVEAYRAIITFACRGDDRDVELAAYNALVNAEPAGIEVIAQEAVKNPNFKTRIILQGVCFQLREDPRAFEALAAGLKDPSRPVALTAVRWLRDAKDLRAVGPLIDALALNEKVREGRIVHDINAALRQITKADLKNSVDWKNFWDSHKDLPPEKLQQQATIGKTQRKGTQVAPPVKFFDIPLNSKRVLFIIDVSGSMEKRDPVPPEPKAPPKPEPAPNGKTTVRKVEKTETRKGAPGEGGKKEDEEPPEERERMHRVKEELIRTIRALDADVYFTIESFDNEIAFLNDPPALIPATPDNKKKAESWVKTLRPRGETWTDTAFEKGLGRVKDVDTVILLSDGQPYRNKKQIPQAQVRKEVKTLNRFVKARINTVGFKQEGDNLRQFLSDLAKDHDGEFMQLK